ncbi:hypothetical protein [Nonomuraea deserti]|uniref:hypothetical protein n=1 Tax=Nonomuraea deserti TaxID=1848322 RepID=UPI001405250D|nr:hypothetical protein [Nonomuraea deserti]
MTETSRRSGDNAFTIFDGSVSVVESLTGDPRRFGVTDVHRVMAIKGGSGTQRAGKT